MIPTNNDVGENQIGEFSSSILKANISILHNFIRIESFSNVHNFRSESYEM